MEICGTAWTCLVVAGLLLIVALWRAIPVWRGLWRWLALIRVDELARVFGRALLVTTPLSEHTTRAKDGKYPKHQQLSNQVFHFGSGLLMLFPRAREGERDAPTAD